MKKAYFIKKTSWQESQKHISIVRTQVFHEEQGIDQNLDLDGNDPSCRHALAFEINNYFPIGTGRIMNDGHIGRVAVLKEWRNLGVGRNLIKKLIEIASDDDNTLRSVYLNAQESAIGFYESLGFIGVGEKFYEAGIPHLRMVCEL